MKFNAENIKAQREKNRERMIKSYDKEADWIVKKAIKAIKKAIRKKAISTDFISVELSDAIGFFSFPDIEEGILKYYVYRKKIINNTLEYFKNLGFNILCYTDIKDENITFTIFF